MNFTKSMIDLVREIRRRAPSEEKPSIKLANSDLFFDLIAWYHSTSDSVVRALIKELLHLAGDDWSARLDQAKTPDELQKLSSESRYETKIYRGQTELTEMAAKEAATLRATQKMYRGQIVP